jgi:hypothetical protein
MTKAGKFYDMEIQIEDYMYDKTVCYASSIRRLQSLALVMANISEIKIIPFKKLPKNYVTQVMLGQMKIR